MANKIKELRKKKGLTQKELSSLIGVSQNTLSYWENGVYDIDTKSLQRLAAIFDVSVDYLLGKDLSDDPAKKELLDLLSGMTAEQLKQFREYAEYLISRR